MIRRLRTEEWGYHTELLALRLLGLRPDRSPYVPKESRAYAAFGFVLHRVYHPWDNLDPRTYEVPTGWRLAWVGNAVRRLP